MADPGAERGAALLTATEAGAYAQVAARTIGKWVAAGHVSTHEIDGVRKIDRASLDAYLVARAEKLLRKAVRVAPGATVGSALTVAPLPDHGAELLAEVRASREEVRELRRELAELRAALVPPEPEDAPQVAPGATPEATPQDEQNDAPQGFWARFRAVFGGGA